MQFKPSAGQFSKIEIIEVNEGSWLTQLLRYLMQIWEKIAEIENSKKWTLLRKLQFKPSAGQLSKIPNLK